MQVFAKLCMLIIYTVVQQCNEGEVADFDVCADHFDCNGERKLLKSVNRNQRYCKNKSGLVCITVLYQCSFQCVMLP